MNEYSLKTPMSEIGLVEWGDPNGIPVLLLHGWLDNAYSFRPLAEILTGFRGETEQPHQGLRLVAMDFPGHGHSSHRPKGVLYNFVDFLCDIRSVVENLGWEKFHLIGHSMGGGLSSLYAGAFPESILNLILIEALGPVTREAEETPEYLGKAIGRYLEHWNKPDKSLFRDREQLVKLRLRAGEMEQESARLLIERGTEELSSGVRLRRDPRLNLPSLIRFTEAQVLEFLKKISAPTTLILGENGYKWEKSFLESRKSSVKNLREITLPGNHHLHMDKPKEMAVIIRDILLGVEL